MLFKITERYFELWSRQVYIVEIGQYFSQTKKQLSLDELQKRYDFIIFEDLYITL